MADRTVDLLLRLSLDKTQQAQVKAGIKSIDIALAEAVTRANQLRESMEKVTQVGMQLAVAGAAITAPLVLSAKKYTDTVGESERTSRKMIQQMQRWEDAQVRIGRVTAESILPALEKALDITEKIAGFAEKNPDAIKGVLITGATLSAVGGLVVTTASIVKTLATIKALTGASAIDAVTGGGVSAATGGGTKVGTIALYASAVIIGAEVGLALGNAINRAMGREEQTRGNVMRSGQQFLASVGPLAGLSYALKAIGADEAASNVWKLNKSIYGLGDATKDTAPIVDNSARDAEIKKRQELQRDISREAVKFSEERKKIEADTGQGLVDISTKYSDRRLKIAEDLRRELASAEQDYLVNRAEIVRDGGIEIQRIEQDSQRRVQQIRRQYAKQEQNAIRSRDALGLVEAQRAKDEEIDQERENVAAEVARRREDIAIRLRDLDASYRRERANRIAAAQQKILDLNETERREILQIRAHQAAVLAELQAAYAKQIMLIKTMFANPFEIPPGGSYGNIAKNGPQARAAGGYMPTGLYSVSERGQREFALSNATTRAAEGLIGGRLTQERLMSAMTMNVNLSNGMTIMQAKRMMQANNNSIMRELGNAFGAL